MLKIGSMLVAALLISALILSLTGATPRAVAEAVKGTVVGKTAANQESATGADNPARQPFQQELFTSSFNTILPVYTVPAGRRLVVDFVSSEAVVPRGQIVNGVFVCVQATDSRVCHVIGSTSHGPLGGLDVFIASQQMELFVGPGQELFVNAASDATSGDAFVSFTGHLVNLP
jgi:hypothetical protein